MVYTAGQPAFYLIREQNGVQNKRQATRIRIQCRPAISGCNPGHRGLIDIESGEKDGSAQYADLCQTSLHSVLAKLDLD